MGLRYHSALITNKVQAWPMIQIPDLFYVRLSKNHSLVRQCITFVLRFYSS
jgi:hypothetical protein